MSLVVNLVKPSDAPKKLSLNLQKNESFLVRLAWDCKSDLDLHALVAVNQGTGAKIAEFEDILSIYNVQRTVRGQPEGYLPLAANKTFSVHGGALVHSPDATDGQLSDEDDEWIRIFPSKLALPGTGYIEVVLVAMIHGPGNPVFKGVKGARVIVENEQGEQLLVVNLSEHFSGFTGLQMGSVIIDGNGPAFSPVGVGFSGSFNDVLAQFS
ncbi:TerD family protein [Comamonas sp. GB3 AK4-5]|uniref:TerD family protein n=1 Tax=Comamonas sp. GB3 AK4-5 TaxID=3231487 RepID=UPI00351F76FC